jgi:hypothetical protein
LRIYCTGSFALNIYLFFPLHKYITDYSIPPPSQKFCI